MDRRVIVVAGRPFRFIVPRPRSRLRREHRNHKCVCKRQPRTHELAFVPYLQRGALRIGAIHAHCRRCLATYDSPVLRIIFQRDAAIRHLLFSPFLPMRTALLLLALFGATSDRVWGHARQVEQTLSGPCKPMGLGYLGRTLLLPGMSPMRVRET